MTRQHAQFVGDDSMARNQDSPGDLDAALERRIPDLQGLLQHLPHKEVQIEEVTGQDYPFGGANDHFDKRIEVGNVNGKSHYVYAYLAKTTSEVKFMIYDYNGNEIPLSEIDQLMKRTVREAAFEFADNAMKLTGLLLYYFMKLGVAEMVDVQDFPLAMQSLGTVAKDFQDRGKEGLLVKLRVKVPVGHLRTGNRHGTKSPGGRGLHRSPLSIRLAPNPRPRLPTNSPAIQDGHSIVSQFIDAENKENELEHEIVQFHKKIADLRERKASTERERKRLWEEMSKEDAVELGVRDRERKRHSVG